MFSWLSAHRPSHAVIVAYLALFVALGGTGYAAVKINGKNIKNRTISGKKLKRNTLGGTQVKESSLGAVNRAKLADGATTLQGLGAGAFLRTTGKAADANTLDGLDSSSFRDRCPGGTTKFGGACMENASRGVTQTFAAAASTCGAAGGWLPNEAELVGFVNATGALLGTGTGGDSNWEMTANLVDINTDLIGAVQNRVAATLDYNEYTLGTPLQFRCVRPLTN